MDKIVKFLKETLESIVDFPNSPLYFIVGLHIFIRLIKERGLMEVANTDSEDLITPEIEEYLNRLLPEHLRVFVAIVFYSWLIKYLYIKLFIA